MFGQILTGTIMFLSRKLKFTELNITDIQDIPSLCTDFKYKFQKRKICSLGAVIIFPLFGNFYVKW